MLTVALHYITQPVSGGIKCRPWCCAAIFKVPFAYE